MGTLTRNRGTFPLLGDLSWHLAVTSRYKLMNNTDSVPLDSCGLTELLPRPGVCLSTAGHCGAPLQC